MALVHALARGFSREHGGFASAVGTTLLVRFDSVEGVEERFPLDPTARTREAEEGNVGLEPAWTVSLEVARKLLDYGAAAYWDMWVTDSFAASPELEQVLLAEGENAGRLMWQISEQAIAESQAVLFNVAETDDERTLALAAMGFATAVAGLVAMRATDFGYLGSLVGWWILAPFCAVSVIVLAAMLATSLSNVYIPIRDALATGGLSLVFPGSLTPAGSLSKVLVTGGTSLLFSKGRRTEAFRFRDEA